MEKSFRSVSHHLLPPLITLERLNTSFGAVTRSGAVKTISFPLCFNIRLCHVFPIEKLPSDSPAEDAWGRSCHHVIVPIPAFLRYWDYTSGSHAASLHNYYPLPPCRFDRGSLTSANIVTCISYRQLQNSHKPDTNEIHWSGLCVYWGEIGAVFVHHAADGTLL